MRVHIASSVSRHCLKSARKRVLARGRFGACFFTEGGRQPPSQYARLSYQRWPFEVGKLKANECPLWFCVVRGIAWHASTTSSVLAAARHTDYCPVILDKEDLRFPNYGLNEKAGGCILGKIFAYSRSRAGTVLGSLGSMHCCFFLQCCSGIESARKF